MFRALWNQHRESVVTSDAKYTALSGADPGFSVGGGANPPGWGAPTYDFAKFCEKLHEIEKILGCGGARAGCAPP